MSPHEHKRRSEKKFQRIITHRQRDVIKNAMPKNEDRKVLRLQCFPLYSILKAVGRVEVDFFTLDIEGSEFAVMESMLEDANDFKLSVAAIEFSHMDLWVNKGTFMEFDYMMRRNGYKKNAFLEHDVIYEKHNVTRVI